MELTLYYIENCPFCRKVLEYIEKKKISLLLKDLNSSEALRLELLSIGGKTQVPCLLIGDLPMYESNDIIAWLNDNIEKLSKISPEIN